MYLVSWQTNLYLTRKCHQLGNRFLSDILPISGTQRDQENPKRISANRLSFQSYDQFTGFSAYGKVFREKSNDGISTSSFVHEWVSSFVVYAKSFSKGRCFLPEIINLQEIFTFHREVTKVEFSCKIIISGRKHLFSLTILTHNTDFENYPWTKLQVEISSFDFPEITCHRPKNPIKRSQLWKRSLLALILLGFFQSRQVPLTGEISLQKRFLSW